MPSASRDKRATSPKERIIPIEIEGDKSKSKSKKKTTTPIVIRHDESDHSDVDTVIVREDVIPLPDKRRDVDRWEVKVVEPKQKKAKDDKKESKKESKKNTAKESKKELKKSTTKETKKDKNKSNATVDINENPVEKKGKSKDDKKKSHESELSQVTITTQPGKSILKHPVATSTPLPDHDSSWADRSSASAGTVVHKKTSKKSKCKGWCCLPCGLCCACAPFECECCDCCYLSCTRCENCVCQCCRKPCSCC